ncbi:hypothetical protein ACQPYK_20290 [Streptosporangium sp. CA-135522]|uniref:hypothetical protein n=1 Tax=Streptosporangium sp. CA-135522 TaxID=3240072 RepID=UPI003D8D589B
MSSPPPDPDAPAVLGPAAPRDAITARELTAQIRASIAAVERAGTLLAARVRRARQGRIRRARLRLLGRLRGGRVRDRG